MGVVTEQMLNNKLLALHTAYLAKVISTNGKTAKIQPLGMTKAYGGIAQKQSPLSSVPILNSARYKHSTKTITYVTEVTVTPKVTKETKTIEDTTITYVSGVTVTPTVLTKSEEIPVLVPLAAGDIVLCVCCERDITEAKKGNNSTPALGHHSMSDSVIVGVL